jgi:hypothetical protein
VCFSDLTNRCSSSANRSSTVRLLDLYGLLVRARSAAGRPRVDPAAPAWTRCGKGQKPPASSLIFSPFNLPVESLAPLSSLRWIFDPAERSITLRLVVGPCFASQAFPQDLKDRAVGREISARAPHRPRPPLGGVTGCRRSIEWWIATAYPPPVD